MRDPPSTKGTNMIIIQLLLAIAIFLAIGVAANLIGEYATKK